jgi:hypothetical protein
MEVAHMQEREAMKRWRQLFKAEIVVPDLHARGIGPSTPIQAGQLEERADDRMNRIPVLDVKESESLTKDLGLMVGLDSETLLGI